MLHTCGLALSEEIVGLAGREEQERNFYFWGEVFGLGRPLGLQAEAEIAQGPISGCYLFCLLLIGCRVRGLIKQKWGCRVNVHYN